MPLLPGLLAMPTVVANALLSFVPDRTLPVRSADRIGVVSPMFDEEAGAGAALGSLLRQTEQFDELAVSVNGGTDGTLEVVRAALAEHGFARVYDAPAAGLAARLERWFREGGPAVSVLDHARPISKSDSINAVLEGGYLTTDRILVVDGDTVFDERFLANLKNQFYRLRIERGEGRRRYVIEDSAIQSGAVMSASPGEGRPMAGLVSRSRSAEYAVAAVLRSGQTTRLGTGRLLGASRLYTVVGCGFTARRDCFPMPSDTLTEDHDFTLEVQNAGSSEARLSVPDLERRGFRVVVDGRELAPSEFFDRQDEVALRRTGNARFVTDALMFTEDPPHLPGYVRQLERWNGGGIENALKRLVGPRPGAALKPNVGFAVLSSLLENLLGLALVLLALPLTLGLNFALPGYGTALDGLVVWFGIDLILTLLLAGTGFRRIWRGQGARGLRLWARVVGATVRSTPALLLLRPLNAVAYVAAASRALPAFRRAREPDPSTTITWVRPRAMTRSRLPVRTTTVALTMLLGNVGLFGGAAYVAGASRPGYKATWQLLQTVQPVRQEEHLALPVTVGVLLPDGERGAAAGPGLEFARDSTRPRPEEHADEELMTVMARRGSDPEISAFCSVDFTAHAADARRTLAGDASGYRPLTYWERLVLARLTPLAAHIEEAATAYDVSAQLLLTVLINESYLDPLAVGPTDDLGLSQVTTDALTLLKALSVDPLSPFANDRLFAGQFSVFDPDFSICAGAAKLAWARRQPGGDDDRFAYARYINPLDGVVRGALNPVHAELVMALDDLQLLVGALSDTIAAYRLDPQLVTAEERALLDVSAAVARGESSLRDAYLATAALVESFGIDDLALYDAVKERLYAADATLTASLGD